MHLVCQPQKVSETDHSGRINDRASICLIANRSTVRRHWLDLVANWRCRAFVPALRVIDGRVFHEQRTAQHG
jgi:hypothetical protein